MKFQEDSIVSLKINNSATNLANLIVRKLCGKYHEQKISDSEKLISRLITNLAKDGLRFRQFNELLLLLNQDIVSEDFFKFFFGEKVNTFDDLKEGIIKFRGLALVCFGNIKFAFRTLSQMNRNQIDATIGFCNKIPSTLIKDFKNRASKLLPISKIEREQTWYLGEITADKVKEEIKKTGKIVTEKKKNKEPIENEFLKFVERLNLMDAEIKSVQQLGLANTDVYLTWDHMDVYIATSMRNNWEFEDTFDFVTEIFKDKKISSMRFRYFDPTQSICDNPRDKGLLESLMLKRAGCAIYLAQENDTMGKDSELAIMLAQGKPVIAYVPEIDPAVYSKKIAKYPLLFFKRRLRMLEAGGIFDRSDCIKELGYYDAQFRKTISNFNEELQTCRSTPELTLWSEKDEEFKDKSNYFKKICNIVAVGEYFNFAKRADVLKRLHPLGIQVDLKSGVSNGVLVVRNKKDCVDLLYNILTNQMKFNIKQTPDKLGVDSRKNNDGYTELQEEISDCAFRVVTNYEKLSNSFWNLYTRKRNNLYSLSSYLDS